MSEEKKNGVLAKILAIAKGEVVSYLFFGVCTTVVNIVVYQFCCSLLEIHALISNIFAWIFAVAFAYITNRLLFFTARRIPWAELRGKPALLSGQGSFRWRWTS